jgi:integrase
LFVTTKSARQAKPWEAVGVCRATYYRKLKERPQLGLLDEFICWKDEALYEVPWSDGYKRRVLYQVKKYLSVYPLVTPNGLAAWISEIPPERFSNRKDRHAAVSLFAKFLNFKGLMSEADYAHLRRLYPKKTRYYRPLQKIITTDQLVSLIEVTQSNPALHRATVMLSETALRLAEYCALEPADMFYSSIPSQALLNVRIGKGGEQRWVPFSRRAQEASRLTDERPRYRWLMDSFKTLSAETGIPFSAHSFRHYRITQWANNPRIPITTTQRWAGHRSLVVTQRYIHIRDEDAMQAAFE